MCNCGNSQDFEECCGPYLSGHNWPPTAESLMRARYSAFARGNIEFLRKTVMGTAAKEFSETDARKWAQESEWLGLQILKTERGQPTDKTGQVEFVAKFKQQGHVLEHHEVSQFQKDSEGRWMFVDGESHVHQEGKGHETHQQFVREEPKVGRNDPCPCGSGKKYKKCCGE